MQLTVAISMDELMIHLDLQIYEKMIISVFYNYSVLSVLYMNVA
jgi:hypothetical protein